MTEPTVVTAVEESKVASKSVTVEVQNEDQEIIEPMTMIEEEGSFPATNVK